MNGDSVSLRRTILHVQPRLPVYRMDFFERLARHYGGALKVMFSPGTQWTLTNPIDRSWAQPIGEIRALPGGFLWQKGGAFVPLAKGDIVVLSGNPRQLSALVLLMRARLAGTRIIWWSHYWSASSRRWRQALRSGPMSMADAILFYTDDEVARYRATVSGARDHRPVAALNNGLDLATIRPLRTAYHAATRDNALLFIGRLMLKSRLGLGLEALARLGEAAPVLHVIGDGEDAPVLRARTVALGLADKVVWHGKMTEEPEIAAITNRCRAFLYPGEVGLSLIHAMAYGLPAILHDNLCQHMPEIAAFRDGETGLTFDQNDAGDLSRAIAEALADPDRLDGWSAQIATIVGPGFSTEDMARRFIALVDDMEARP